jgi:hypothetical protein
MIQKIPFVLKLSKHKALSFYSWLERRYAHGCCCILDGNRKSNADEEALVCRVQNPSDNTNYLTLCGHQRPAGVPRIYRGVELDKVCQETLSFRREVFPPETRHHSGRR